MWATKKRRKGGGKQTTKESKTSIKGGTESVSEIRQHSPHKTEGSLDPNGNRSHSEGGRKYKFSYTRKLQKLREHNALGD